MLRTHKLVVGLAMLLPVAIGCHHGKPKGPDPYQSQVQWKPYNGKKMRVVVSDFGNRSGYGGVQYSQTAQKMLSSALTQSGHFDVFEGDAIRSVIDQQAFQNTGLVDAASAVKIGGMTGAQFLVVGAITELGESHDSLGVGNISTETKTYKATIDVSVIDLSTGQTILADTQSASVADKSFQVGIFGKSSKSDDSRVVSAIRDSIDKVAQNLVDKTPTSGFDFQIANVDDSGKVYVNAGQGDVTPGQQLRVYRRGKEIKDPATGAHLDWEESEIGAVEVVEIKARSATCRILKGRSFAAGDVVRP